MPAYHDNVSRAEKAAGGLKNRKMNGGGEPPVATPEEITAIRLRLHGNGYHPVPIVGIHVAGVNSRRVVASDERRIDCSVRYPGKEGPLDVSEVWARWTPANGRRRGWGQPF